MWTFYTVTIQIQMVIIGNILRQSLLVHHPHMGLFTRNMIGMGGPLVENKSAQRRNLLKYYIVHHKFYIHTLGLNPNFSGESPLSNCLNYGTGSSNSR